MSEWPSVSAKAVATLERTSSATVAMFGSVLAWTPGREPVACWPLSTPAPTSSFSSAFLLMTIFGSSRRCDWTGVDFGRCSVRLFCDEVLFEAVAFVDDFDRSPTSPPSFARRSAVSLPTATLREFRLSSFFGFFCFTFPSVSAAFTLAAVTRTGGSAGWFWTAGESDTTAVVVFDEPSRAHFFSVPSPESTRRSTLVSARAWALSSYHVVDRMADWLFPKALDALFAFLSITRRAVFDAGVESPESSSDGRRPSTDLSRRKPLSLRPRESPATHSPSSSVES